MSLATVIEAADHERDSMQPDEWFDFLIQLRDAIQKRIDAQVQRDIAAHMPQFSAEGGSKP